MRNQYLETGPYLHVGPTVDNNGTDLVYEARLALAEHQRLAKGPKGPISGIHRVDLPSGTSITTSINASGIVPSFTATVEVPDVDTAVPAPIINASFVCYPAAQVDAVFGWGDPYTPSNQPLGTVATSFNVSKHLERGVIIKNDVVTTVQHGTLDEYPNVGLNNWRNGTDIITWSPTPVADYAGQGHHQVFHHNTVLYSNPSVYRVKAACLQYNGPVTYCYVLVSTNYYGFGEDDIGIVRFAVEKDTEGVYQQIGTIETNYSVTGFTGNRPVIHVEANSSGTEMVLNTYSPFEDPIFVCYTVSLGAVGAVSLSEYSNFEGIEIEATVSGMECYAYPCSDTGTSNASIDAEITKTIKVGYDDNDSLVPVYAKTILTDTDTSTASATTASGTITRTIKRKLIIGSTVIFTGTEIDYTSTGQAVCGPPGGPFFSWHRTKEAKIFFTDPNLIDIRKKRAAIVEIDGGIEYDDAALGGPPSVTYDWTGAVKAFLYPGRINIGIEDCEYPETEQDSFFDEDGSYYWEDFSFCISPPSTTNEDIEDEVIQYLGTRVVLGGNDFVDATHSVLKNCFIEDVGDGNTVISVSFSGLGADPVGAGLYLEGAIDLAQELSISGFKYPNFRAEGIGIISLEPE